VGGQIQSAATIAAAEFDGELTKFGLSPNMKSPVATISHSEKRITNVRNLDLLNSISLLSESRQTLPSDVKHSARDEALSSLFGEMRQATAVEHPFAVLPRINNSLL
jgi:hypothetical protein